MLEELLLVDLVFQTFKCFFSQIWWSLPEEGVDGIGLREHIESFQNTIQKTDH